MSSNGLRGFVFFLLLVVVVVVVVVGGEFSQKLISSGDCSVDKGHFVFSLWFCCWWCGVVLLLWCGLVLLMEVFFF